MLNSIQFALGHKTAQVQGLCLFFVFCIFGFLCLRTVCLCIYDVPEHTFTPILVCICVVRTSHVWAIIVNKDTLVAELTKSPEIHKKSCPVVLGLIIYAGGDIHGESNCSLRFEIQLSCKVTFKGT